MAGCERSLAKSGNTKANPEHNHHDVILDGLEEKLHQVQENAWSVLRLRVVEHLVKRLMVVMPLSARLIYARRKSTCCSSWGWSLPSCWSWC
jgi:hypothetical protein